jgi:hypothetical protein
MLEGRLQISLTGESTLGHSDCYPAIWGHIVRVEGGTWHGVMAGTSAITKANSRSCVERALERIQ